MESRIYGDVVDINTEKTTDFYNKRAKDNNSREQEYTTVLLGDQNPEYAKKWDEYEKSIIKPKLSIDKTKKVLDLGCGIGRWAQDVVDDCNYYCGVDFSRDMINVARERVNRSNCNFYNLSFNEAISSELIKNNQYDVIILTGVSMYINDNVLKNCYDGLPSLINNDAVIYIEESVGLDQRLTLVDLWSDSLNSYYNAIYRTRIEYLTLLRNIISRCEIIDEGYMDYLDKAEQKETSHWYIVMKYKGLDYNQTIDVNNDNSIVKRVKK